MIYHSIYFVLILNFSNDNDYSCTKVWNGEGSGLRRGSGYGMIVAQSSLIIFP